MGYFPNGTAGDAYEAEFCNRCAHEDEEKGCPVMMAHILHAYGENGKGSPAEQILEMLIPRKADGFNDRCAMFVPRDRLKSPRRPGSTPDGGTCRHWELEPIVNDADQKIGERCARCRKPFALSLGGAP